MSVKRDVEITHLHIKIENSRTLIVPYDCITFFTCLLRSAHNVTNYTIFTATLNAQPSKVTELQSTFGARFQCGSLSGQFRPVYGHRIASRVQNKIYNFSTYGGFCDRLWLVCRRWTILL